MVVVVAVIGVGCEFDPLIQLVLTVVTEIQLLVVRTDDDALVVLEFHGQAALEFLVTHVQGQVVPLIKAGPEHLLEPVCTGDGAPRVVFFIVPGIDGHAGVGMGRPENGQHVRSLQALGQIGEGPCSRDHIVGGIDTLACFLGRDQNDTAGTGSGSVNGGRSSVFQHHDALHLGHGGDRSAGDAIHHPQHGIAALGPLAADDDGHTRSRRTVIGRDRHTGDLPLQHAGSGSNRPGRELFGIVHDTHGGGQVLFPGLGAVTQGNGLLQDFGILFQDKIQLVAPVQVNLLRCVTQT